MLASVIVPMSVSAQDDDTKLVIYSHDGSAPVEISIYDIRKVTFQDDTFTMVYEDGIAADQQFAYDDVRCVKFSGETTGIGSVQSDQLGDDITISRGASSIIVGGVTERAQLRLFDISGRPVLSQTLTSDTTISTEALPAGVYILRVNNKTFKFSI